MGDSGIDYVTKSWNPISGCSPISAGCDGCWAANMARRFDRPGAAYEGMTTKVKKGAKFNGTTRFFPERIDEPLRWRKPQTVAVSFMGDIFHETVTWEMQQDVFWRMSIAAKHRFLILTKRAGNMERALRRWVPTKNIWLGVSVENQAAADERIPLLLETPAAHRFVSYEPAIDEVDFACIKITRLSDDPPGPPNPPRWVNALTGQMYHYQHGPVKSITKLNKLDWLVMGSESGAGARPMDEDWVRQVRDQCQAAGTPFMYKQNFVNGKKVHFPELDGRRWRETPWD